MDTQHSLLVAAWQGLPLPIFEVAIDLDRDEADYARQLARLIDTALTYVVLAGMARCADAPGWPELAASLCTLFVDPGPGKRMRAISGLERHRPGCTGWRLEDPVEEGRALWTAARRPARRSAPTVLECLGLLAEFRNKGPGHDELPADAEKELGLAVRGILPYLFDRNQVVKGIRLLVLSDVSRVGGGQVEWTARVCAGAIAARYREGQRLLSPEQPWMVRNAVCLRDRNGGELVSLEPFIRWHGEHLYLLHSLGGKAPCLLQPARRTELPMQVDTEAFDRRLPGWRTASQGLRARPAVAEQTERQNAREVASTPAASAGVWAHHDAPATPQQAPTVGVPRLARPPSDTNNAPLEVEPQHVRRGNELLWWALGVAACCVVIALAVAGFVVGHRLVFGPVTDPAGPMSSGDRLASGGPQNPSLALAGVASCPPNWVPVDAGIPLCMQEREATWGDMRRVGITDVRAGCGPTEYGCREQCTHASDDRMPVNCICATVAETVCQRLAPPYGRLPTSDEWERVVGWQQSYIPSARSNLCDWRLSATQSADSRCLACAPLDDSVRAGQPSRVTRPHDFDDGRAGVAMVGPGNADRLGSLQDIFGNLSELVRMDRGDEAVALESRIYAAIGRNYLSGLPEPGGPVVRYPIPPNDHGRQYGFRCVVPLIDVTVSQ